MRNLCAAKLIDIMNSDLIHETIYLILLIVGDVFVFVGLIFVICRSLLWYSNIIRASIICFVVCCLCLVVKTILYIVKGHSISAWELCHLILLIFISYILWVQVSRL